MKDKLAPPPTQGFVKFQAVEEAKAAIEGVKAAAEGGKVLICGAESELTVLEVGVGGIDKYSTSVFFEKILRYYYIPTIGVADLQAPLNNMMRSS